MPQQPAARDIARQGLPAATRERTEPWYFVTIERVHPLRGTIRATVGVQAKDEAHARRRAKDHQVVGVIPANLGGWIFCTERFPLKPIQLCGCGCGHAVSRTDIVAKAAGYASRFCLEDALGEGGNYRGNGRDD